jgi:hypothetical protein
VSKDQCWTYQQFEACISTEAPESVSTWAEQNVQIVGSARSEFYRANITPWTKEPLECANAPGVRRVTFVKPVQCGGSTVGEIAILFWLSHWPGGDIQYNWPNDLVASSRWSKHMEKRLKGCPPVMARVSKDRFDWKDGLIVFPHCNFIMQGINTERAVASDSIRGQVNEELHDVDNWIPGRLDQAYGRTTAYWNSIIFNISNAGHVGSELHKAFESGSQEHWEVKCPGCGRFHRMQDKWNAERPDLGGLRYELQPDRKSGDEVDYRFVSKTVRYQMPCGFEVRDTVTERRALSLSGRYSEPDNLKADPSERSFTLSAVSVDFIPWIDLIKQKHKAYRARKLGDPRPWLTFLRERSCQFVGLDDRRPESTPIVLSSRQKDRAGLPNRLWRLCFFDYQKGIKELGESPHWWGVIWDIDAAGNVLLVCEDKLNSEGEVLDMVRRHDVKPICVGVDASFTGEDRYVYFFCLRHGFNAIKVHGQKTGERTFTHGDGVRRAWTEPEPLWPHSANQQGPTKENPVEEPEFWNVSQSGAMDALAHLMARKRPKADKPNEEESCFEIPADVSEDFKLHFRAWTREKFRVPATNALEERWKKVSEKAPDHLYMCCTYLALWCEMAGATGAEIVEQLELPQTETVQA